MLRKILIVLTILFLLVVGAGICVHYWTQAYLKREAKARPEPRLLIGEGRFDKRVFYAGDELGNISQILVGWPADKEGAALAVVGNKGAHFLDATGRSTKWIGFSTFVASPVEVARIDANGDYAYLTRDESWFDRATLFDEKGQVSWSYTGGGFLSGVDDSVSGDIYGDGKLSVVIGLNGGGGLVLVNREGKIVWKKKEGNVWHVETLDTNGDGRDEILHSNAPGQLLVRNANGDVIAEYLPGHYVADFTLTRWAEEQHPTHILVPTTEGQEGSSKSIFVVLDAKGKTVAQLESPLGDLLNKTKAATVHYGKGVEYFAVLQNNSPWRRSMLLLYGKDGQIVYQEILGESCLGIAALPQKDGERLLIGCAGRIWEYSPVSQTNAGPTKRTSKSH
jgi:hypothetical protein